MQKFLNQLFNVFIFKVPALALECSLQNTKPNAMLSDHEEWHPEAVQAFKELLVDYEIGACKVIAEVYSVTPGWIPFKIFLCMLGIKPLV